MANNHHERLVEATYHTQLQLRKIRTAVLDNTRGVFAGASLESATKLINGLTALAMTYLVGKRAGVFNDRAQALKQAITQADQKWGHLSPSSSVGQNRPVSLVDWMETLAGSRDPWSILAEQNDLTKHITLKDADTIVTPLSSGPLLVNLARKLTKTKSRLVLTAVEPISLYDYNTHHIVPRTVFPRSETWPATGKTYIIDDLKQSGLTALAIRTALIKAGREVP